jgi:DNA-binding MarR family transcriptional regulator
MPKQHYKLDSYHPTTSVGYLLKAALRALQDRVQLRFAKEGLTFQQWIVLMHIREGLALTVATLCRETRHDSGAMTRLIDQLEKRGLIERRRSSKDRRVVELLLTKEGNKTIEALKPLVVDTLNEALDGFTRQEVRDFEIYLRRIAQRWADSDTVATEDSAA